MPAFATTDLHASYASSDHTEPAIQARGLVKTYGRGDGRVVALDGIDVEIASGRFTAIMGASGSGKSTLMHCLAGLDAPTTGMVYYGDTDITRLRDNELSRLRSRRIGFVFQSFNLLPTLSAGQNILLPLELAGVPLNREWFDQLTEQLGIRDRLSHRPAQMSGGQQQRVAIARALIARPDVVFADEPTGALDSRNSAVILSLLRDAVRQNGQTIVMVTHEAGAAAYADRVILLADGQIVGELDSPSQQDVQDAVSALAVPAQSS